MCVCVCVCVQSHEVIFFVFSYMVASRTSVVIFVLMVS